MLGNLAFFLGNGFILGKDNASLCYEGIISQYEDVVSQHEHVVFQYERLLMAEWAKRNHIAPLAAHCRRPVNLEWAEEGASEEEIALVVAPTPNDLIN